MKFALLIYGDEQAAAHATPEQMQAQGDAYEVFTKSIIETGQFLDGDPFLPTSSATSVRRTVRVKSPLLPVSARSRSEGSQGLPC